MKNVFYTFFISIVFFSLISCNNSEEKQETVGRIIFQKYLSCFPECTIDFYKSTVSLELSGVAYYHDSLFIVSEQKVPGTSSFFRSPFKIPFRRTRLSPVIDEDILNSINFTGLTITPYQKYLFAVTSFSKAGKFKPEWDSNNMLFYKRLNPPKPFLLANPITRSGVSSSVNLHRKLRNALRTKLYKKGPPYFEISGIAAIRKNYLLFSVSKIGQNSENYDNVNVIIGAKYQIIDNEFSFIEEIKELYRFEPEVNFNLRGPLRLSDIEYDKYNDRLYLLTAFSQSFKDIDLGGYIWVLPMRDFILKKEPSLVVDDDGLPISFAHKPGGIAVLDKNQVLIVFDDDRITGSDVIIDKRTQFKRKLNEASYLILDLNN